MSDKSAVGWIFGGIGIALLLMMLIGAVGLIVIFYVIGTGSN